MEVVKINLTKNKRAVKKVHPYHVPRYTQEDFLFALHEDIEQDYDLNITGFSKDTTGKRSDCCTQYRINNKTIWVRDDNGRGPRRNLNDPCEFKYTVTVTRVSDGKKIVLDPRIVNE